MVSEVARRIKARLAKHKDVRRYITFEIVRKFKIRGQGKGLLR
jgi:hypothetical protein